jgi:flavodoxin I
VTPIKDERQGVIMKTLVVYESAYGNTEKIAQGIGRAFYGGAKIARPSEVNPTEVRTFDLLIVGSPTQGGKPVQAIQDFLSKNSEAIKGIKVAAFDTRLSTRWVGIFGYAAGKIGDALKARGGNLVAPPEAFFVNGKGGPLKEGELERAELWAKVLGANCVEATAPTNVP